MLKSNTDSACAPIPTRVPLKITRPSLDRVKPVWFGSGQTGSMRPGKVGSIDLIWLSFDSTRPWIWPDDVISGYTDIITCIYLKKKFLPSLALGIHAHIQNHAPHMVRVEAREVVVWHVACAWTSKVMPNAKLRCVGVHKAFSSVTNFFCLVLVWLKIKFCTFSYKSIWYLAYGNSLLDKSCVNYYFLEKANSSSRPRRSSGF